MSVPAGNDKTGMAVRAGLGILMREENDEGPEQTQRANRQQVADFAGFAGRRCVIVTAVVEGEERARKDEQERAGQGEGPQSLESVAEEPWGMPIHQTGVYNHDQVESTRSLTMSLAGRDHDNHKLPA